MVGGYVYFIWFVICRVVMVVVWVVDRCDCVIVGWYVCVSVFVFGDCCWLVVVCVGFVVVLWLVVGWYCG